MATSHWGVLPGVWGENGGGFKPVTASLWSPPCGHLPAVTAPPPPLPGLSQPLGKVHTPQEPGASRGAGLRSPGQAQGMPKLLNCKPFFSQTFPQTLGFPSKQPQLRNQEGNLCSLFSVLCHTSPSCELKEGCCPAGRAGAGRGQ